MTKKLVLPTVLTLSILMTSCNNTKPNNDTTSNTNNNATVEQNKDNNNSSKSETNKTADSNKTNEEAKIDKIKLSIYTIDENSLEPNESSTINVDSNLTLENKLKQLSKTVSEKLFDNLSIEVKSIDTVNGKKVATINLTDSNNKKWASKFQGSTGGKITSNALLENFLQSNNKSKGEWIDGVKFLYNNKTIEYEHASDLSNIKYVN